jgi:hypothetical protein
MSTFFPKTTAQWHLEEPTVIRRFTLSLVEMAVLTGVTLRLYRALVSTQTSGSWVWFVALCFGILLLCAMATAHLANYPVQRWVWRAPLFVLIEVAAESLTSLLLIFVGREPSGTARAVWSDWLPLAGTTLWTRMVIVCGWALVLAFVVFVVRRTILREEKIEEEVVEEAATQA